LLKKRVERDSKPKKKRREKKEKEKWKHQKEVIQEIMTTSTTTCMIQRGPSMIEFNDLNLGR
jgi:hypothetical protein